MKRSSTSPVTMLCIGCVAIVCIILITVTIRASGRTARFAPQFYMSSKDATTAAPVGVVGDAGGASSGSGPSLLVRDVESALAHSNWQPVRSNPYLLALLQPCSDAGATTLTREAAEIVTAFVETGYASGGPTDMPLDALPKYAAARAADPTCVSAALGHAIVLAMARKPAECIEATKAALKVSPAEPHAHLWQGICSELGGADSAAHYHRVRDFAPAMCVEVFAQRCDSAYFPYRLFSEWGVKSARGREIETNALLRTLLAWEFGVQALSAMSPMPREDAVRFATCSYIKIPMMMQGIVLKSFQEMWLALIAEGELKFGDPQVPSRYGHSNDMVSHFLLGVYNDMVQRIAGRLTKPTYTYFGGYKGGSILHPHTDRLACEFTMTFQIYLDPPLPLWSFKIDTRTYAVSPSERGGAKPRPDDPHLVKIELAPGDGGMIRGRKVTHFRDELPRNQTSLGIFFHYVFDDFPEDKFGM